LRISVESSEKDDLAARLKAQLTSEKAKSQDLAAKLAAMSAASSDASGKRIKVGLFCSCAGSLLTLDPLVRTLALAQKVAAAEAVREELLVEGQRLMEDKQKLEATVKEVRKALQGKHQELRKALEDKAEVEKMAEGFEKELKSAGITYEKNEEKMTQIRNMSQETAKQLTKVEREKASLQESDANDSRSPFPKYRSLLTLFRTSGASRGS
jgi:hypothetical protein